MKVTTDACIQGAWTPILPSVKRVLDIGTGTGLLSLMLAQRSDDVIIDAIEFDKDAASQAADNVNTSPWKGRINIIEGDVRTHQFRDKYDLIISNPPFFNNSLLSDKEAKNNARHTLSLTYTDLLNAVTENLSEGGYISILLPAEEYMLWNELMAVHGWAEFGKLSVNHKPGALVKRIVGLFSKADRVVTEQSLTIHNDNGYTREFIDLMAPFYLNL